MASTINADTTNGVVVTSDTSGEIELQSAGTTIATVDSTGIAMASGKTIQNASGDVVTNTPAFGIKFGDNQAISEAVYTKVQYDTVEFDTDSVFDTSTNRFTVPTGKAGLYLINATVRLDSDANTNFRNDAIVLRKNGSNVKYIANNFNDNYIRANTSVLSTILDLVVGDYIEIYAYINTIDNTGGTIYDGRYTFISGQKLIT